MFKKENIRKNFFRGKQIADQYLGRAEKSEVLSDDLQTADKRVEVVKQVCQNTVKKLSGSLQGTGPDVEKRLKKMPEAAVGHSMIESANLVGPDCTMGEMFQMCGDCQSSLANIHLQYELDIEKNVVKPIEEILETEIPQISKLKKQLNKVTLDMDSAKTRWNTAVRQTQVPGVNMASASAKADVVKEELEEASNRVDQAKDALTTGIFNFMSREADHSKNLIALLETQSIYHKKALFEIEKVLPKMREKLSCTPSKPVYGTSLEEHLRVTNRDIAVVLEVCILYLLENGLEEEGLFRIAGMASKLKKLKASFDAGIDVVDSGEMDQHTVAGALKQYLRELPEPLLTFQLYKPFVEAVQQPQEKRLQALWCVVDRLPKPNYDNLRYLIKFLAKLSEQSSVNKMTPGNIGIVIGPNLIWSEGDSGPNMMNTGMLSLITELIVQHADWFFPGALDFHMTQRGSAPPHKDSRQEISSQSIAASAMTTDDSLTTISVATGSSSFGQASGSATPGQSSGSSGDTVSAVEDQSRADQYTDHGQYGAIEDSEKYLTAEGDLRQSKTFPGTDNHLSNSHRAPTNPIITFNPKERPKRPSSRPSSMVTPTAPKSVHSDVYSTVFALHSLGDGAWPGYLNKVRAIWDDQLQHRPADFSPDKTCPGSSSGVTRGQGHSEGQGQSQDINFVCGPSSGNSSPVMNKSSDANEHAELERTSSSQSGSSQGTPVSINSPSSQETVSQLVPPSTPPTVSRSPSISPVSSNPSLHEGAPLAESEDLGTPVSRKTIRKPAPPPPPNRPYSVAVSASVKPGHQFQTWPRQAEGPVQGAINPLSTSDKQKTLPPERPIPPERHSSQTSHHPHVDRPKVPPPVAPMHQRSASTGGTITIAPTQPTVTSSTSQPEEPKKTGTL